MLFNLLIAKSTATFVQFSASTLHVVLRDLKLDASRNVMKNVNSLLMLLNLLIANQQYRLLSFPRQDYTLF